MPSIQRHLAYQEESQFTPEQALEWALEYYRNSHHWPERRWRVEVHRGVQINSRLLRHDQASRTATELGGRVVELIPGRAKYLESIGEAPSRESPLDREAANLELGECPRCHAPSGKACRSPAGDRTKPHRVRTGWLPRGAELAKNLPACPHCGAAPGDPCTAPASDRFRPHRARTKAPKAIQKAKKRRERAARKRKEK